MLNRFMITLYSPGTKFFIRNIDGRLFTGKPIPSPVALYKIKKMGVTQVIDLREDAFWKRLTERIGCTLAGIKYKNIKVKTHTYNIPSVEFFNDINKKIVSNDGKTYLHCKYGRHRTGMCVAAYEKEVLKKNALNVYISLTNKFPELSEFGNLRIKNKLRIVYDKFVNLYHLNGNHQTGNFNYNPR